METAELGAFWIAELVAMVKKQRDGVAGNLSKLKQNGIYAAQHNAYLEVADRMLAAAPAPAVVQAEVSEQDKIDAERYRWLRLQDWFDNTLCVLRNPKDILQSRGGFGADCPSMSRLDDAIDAARGAA